MVYANPNLMAVDGSTFEGGTHAWTTPSANTTLTVVSGQFLTGSYSLRFTATAAVPSGAESVSANTPYVRDVIPGVTYVAHIPVRVSATGAGRSVKARMLFYAETGGNIGYTDSTIQLDPAQTGWVPANYLSVSMVAPPDAVRVRVTFYAYGLAAGEYVNVDDVILTNVTDRYGELLEFETRSIESDTSRWTAQNATLRRAFGYLATGAGYHCLAGASTAASGVMYLRTTALYPVTPGKSYVTYGAIQCATATNTGSVGIEWYTSAGVWISTTSLPLSFSPTIQRVACSGVAPANATKARPVFSMVPTAVGQEAALDDVSFASPQTTPAGAARNLLTYEEWSTESTLPAWTVTGGSTARAYFTSALTEGFFALRVTPSVPGAGTVQARLDRLAPVTPGLTYQVGATAFRHSTSPGQAIVSMMRATIDWYDSSGAPFMIDEPDQFYPVESPDEWYASVNTETRTCPQGAAYARVGLELVCDTPLIDFWSVDNIFLVEATSEYDLTANSDIGCVTLKVNYVSPNVPKNQRITIRRIDESGDSTPMRTYGGEWELTPNPFSPLIVEDYEAPLGSRVWYQVTWSNEDGSLYGSRLFTRPITAPVLDNGDYVWFKAPGVPALNTRVMMEGPLTWAREARSARYDIVGRKHPVHRTDVRAGRTSNITVLIWDAGAHDQFNNLLDAGGPALIQAMPGYGIEGNLYVAVGAVEVEPLSPDAREDGWRWKLAVTEVDRPDGGLQGSAASTWASILSGYSTWEALFFGNETWTDVLTGG
ncbi:hypothetical protein ACWCXC_15575 [Streptomyces sp. NPDC001515]